MSPTESTKRVTRSSTQSQTLKARADAMEDQIPVKDKKIGGIEKHRAKPKGQAGHTAKAASKSKPNPKRERDLANNKEKGEDAPEPSPSPTAPNVTTSTITSEQVNKPITCHTYTPSTTPTSPPLLFTHGAGGTLSAPAVINFCTGFISSSSTPVFAFQGSMNLGARTKAFHACLAHVRGVKGGAQKLLLGGRSMGARAAVMAATEEIAAGDGGQGEMGRLVLVSYPLQGPKEIRDRILIDLPEGVGVLFIVGERDAMCPLELLEGVREKMRAKSRVVVVRGADHGMNVRPADRTREVGEETGKVAASWLSGEIEAEGETLYVRGKE